MLHEILLSLSGHPSPLLTADHSSPSSILSPPEKALLASVAHLNAIHRQLLTHTASIAKSHPSFICRAVATAISSHHLEQFQTRILEVEQGILRRDAGLVGAYDIVPLTAVVGSFDGWTRRLEWFLEVVKIMLKGEGKGKECTGARIIDWLCDAMKTGYTDIEEAASSLVRVAETAWLKQVSSWILYGRLPTFGREDFFVRVVDGGEYEIKKDLLPAFVTTATAASLLFVGRSLNHIKVRGSSGTSSLDLPILSAQLKQLSSLQFPIKNAEFSRVIASIRLSLSQTTLQKLLPLSKVVEVLTLLREFFLLGRGEFALALISEADEKIRSRWQRQDTIAYEKQSGLANVIIKDGEVASVLARTWTAMFALQGAQEDTEEDELLDLAQELISLTIAKQTAAPATKSGPTIASTPFRNLLLSTPVSLTLAISSPLDLFLTPQDVQIYTSINAYLLSIHRAHLRLTDLWKITSLRREHPAPPVAPHGSSSAGRAKVKLLRERSTARAEAMRSVWATSSAAVFFLAETEAYLQGEVVQGMWDNFKTWLVHDSENTKSGNIPDPKSAATAELDDTDDEDDIWLSAAKEEDAHPPISPTKITHDPQTLSNAHRLYLRQLISSLLLTEIPFTTSLYTLLLSIDHLVALIHRVHTIWTSLDLEADEGVVDAFSDYAKEEVDVRSQLREIGNKVKEGIRTVVQVLREMDARGDEDFLVEAGWDDHDEMVDSTQGERYKPKRIGRVDRLLMKLDFGGWFGDGAAGVAGSKEDALGSDDDDF